MCNALIHYTLIYTLHNKSEALLLSMIKSSEREAPKIYKIAKPVSLRDSLSLNLSTDRSGL